MKMVVQHNPDHPVKIGDMLNAHNSFNNSWSTLPYARMNLDFRVEEIHETVTVKSICETKVTVMPVFNLEF